jgi:hypothetical protein
VLILWLLLTAGAVAIQRYDTRRRNAVDVLESTGFPLAFWIAVGFLLSWNAFTWGFFPTVLSVAIWMTAMIGERRWIARQRADGISESKAFPLWFWIVLGFVVAAAFLVAFVIDGMMWEPAGCPDGRWC